jgi:hypothetical protein
VGIYRLTWDEEQWSAVVNTKMKIWAHGRCSSETLISATRYQEVTGTAKISIRWVSRRNGDQSVKVTQKLPNIKQIITNWLKKGTMHVKYGRRIK